MMTKRELKRTAAKPSLDFSIPKVQIHQGASTLNQLQKLKEGTKERIDWAGGILNIPAIWRQTQGAGVKVAILDTGIDTDHPDLESAIILSKDFTGDGIEDNNGHGTHCAGIVGARLNGVGFVGVAPQAELLIAKVLGNDGRGASAWIADGIYWAVDNDADIISMSLGASQSSPEIYQAVQYALYNGVFVICAAGNEGELFTNSVGYPGRYGGVITVAAHDINGNPSGFSSRGGEVDVMAPGTEIWSTYKDGGYQSLSGTSMATPFVAGLAALITAKHKSTASNNTPLQNNEDLKNHLLLMATHPGYHDNQTGYGPLQPFTYFNQS